jgi:hypothetical protein
MGSMVIKYKHIGVATTRTTYEDGTIEDVDHLKNDVSNLERNSR